MRKRFSGWFDAASDRTRTLTVIFGGVLALTTFLFLMYLTKGLILFIAFLALGSFAIYTAVDSVLNDQRRRERRSLERQLEQGLNHSVYRSPLNDPRPHKSAWRRTR